MERETRKRELNGPLGHRPIAQQVSPPFDYKVKVTSDFIWAPKISFPRQHSSEDFFVTLTTWEKNTTEICNCNSQSMELQAKFIY